MPRLTEQQVFELASRDTHDRRRAEAMGWHFHQVKVHYEGRLDSWVLDMEFTCFCGRRERFRAVVDDGAAAELPEATNMGRMLRQHGSFSRKHLEEDGFSENEIAEIERRGYEFDREQMGCKWTTSTSRSSLGSSRR